MTRKNPLEKKAAALDYFTSEPTEEKAKPAGSGKALRVSFAVDDMQKYEVLKVYAALQKKQMKDIFEEMITEYLQAHAGDNPIISNLVNDITSKEGEK